MRLLEPKLTLLLSYSSIRFKLMLASNKEQFARLMIAWELEANNSAQERLFIMPHCKAFRLMPPTFGWGVEFMFLTSLGAQSIFKTKLVRTPSAFKGINRSPLN